MNPNLTAITILVAWPVIGIILGILLPIRHAVLLAILGGNLLLPATAIALPGFPNYTKTVAAGLGALLPSVVFESAKLFGLRPKLLDTFFVGFLLAPSLSSLANQQGLYDAGSTLVNRFLEWGVAYWVGRALFNDLHSLKDLSKGIVLSGVLYAPLCIFEIALSPQLSRIVYGFRPSAFSMTYRMGGWRPMVFMQHGLALAAWMAAATLVAWILWRSKAIRQICGIPMPWIAIGLVILTIWLRSTGAAILLLGLICAAEFIQITRLRIILIVMAMIPMGYIGLRTFGWDGHQMISLASQLDADRAQSLEVRLENDQMIADKAMQRPVFGWGGWGRWRVKDEYGRDITISDSWWAILLGTTGVFGLVCTYATFISPLFPLSRHKSKARIFYGPVGAAWAVGFGVLLFVLDTLANAMPNTSFILMSACLVSVYPLVTPEAMKRMYAQRQPSSPNAQHPTVAPTPTATDPQPTDPAHNPLPDQSS